MQQSLRIAAIDHVACLDIQLQALERSNRLADEQSGLGVEWHVGSEQDVLDSWKLVRFIRHLPNLTGEEKAQMEKLNPKSPAELKAEEEEERFMGGSDLAGRTSIDLSL